MRGIQGICKISLLFSYFSINLNYPKIKKILKQVTHFFSWTSNKMVDISLKNMFYKEHI